MSAGNDFFDGMHLVDDAVQGLLVGLSVHSVDESMVELHPLCEGLGKNDGGANANGPFGAVRVTVKPGGFSGLEGASYVVTVLSE